MAKNVKIYTTNSCAYCDTVKKFLDGKNQSYEVINLDSDPDKIEEFKTLTDVMVVPLVAVYDEAAPDEKPRIVQGWDAAKLTEAIS